MYNTLASIVCLCQKHDQNPVLCVPNQVDPCGVTCNSYNFPIIQNTFYPSFATSSVPSLLCHPQALLPCSTPPSVLPHQTASAGTTVLAESFCLEHVVSLLSTPPRCEPVGRDHSSSNVVARNAPR